MTRHIERGENLDREGPDAAQWRKSKTGVCQPGIGPHAIPCLAWNFMPAKQSGLDKVNVHIAALVWGKASARRCVR
jgi:hypothetical protein